MKPKILEKCYRVTSDEGLDYTVYATTPGKAKYQTHLDLEWGEPKMMLTFRAKRYPELDLLENTPHFLTEKLTEKQLGKMKHALGLTNRRESYRNRYVTQYDKDWEDLIAMGLAEKSDRNVMRDNVYWVSDLGIEVVKSTLPILRTTFNKKHEIKTI